MNRIVLSLAAIVAFAAPAVAQDVSSGSSSNAIGVGTGVSRATSVNTFTSPSSTVNRTSGSLRTVGTAYAPSIASAGIETCLGGVSASAGFMGGSFAFGTSVPDNSCNRRLTARTLWNFNQKNAALYVMCNEPEAAAGLAQAGIACPSYQDQPRAVAASYGGVVPVAYSSGRSGSSCVRDGAFVPCN